MTRAVWNGTVVAEVARTVAVEGNPYVPPDALRREYVATSRTRTWCFWKGVARYYTVRVGGASLPHGAGYHPRPSPPARRIPGHAAFGPGVVVEDHREPE
ncbi:DUF427 domain-containing protein [Streptomyces chumphonensis]|uniref:DUF427 domain-containing protein n=1 Tax=Streptomyces chumphonensis TaxID=1214925 RepID=A0A927IEL3_9ACTN|nr:DUF427 domain-containing protein [Streptomyces chumphonensis]MBD3934277.1 DUF427 domain-containing protein [Streptomyces chumphonensis]